MPAKSTETKSPAKSSSKTKGKGGLGRGISNLINVEEKKKEDNVVVKEVVKCLFQYSVSIMRLRD